MRYVLGLLIFTLIFVSNAMAQDSSREQKLQKIIDLNERLKASVNEYLMPEAKDISEAEKNGFEVFRILPRGKIDLQIGIKGGGAYYSFSKKSHDYNDTPQIELQQNKLLTGFAGANYGFIADLGSIPLATVNKESYGVSFLANYKPPTSITKIRSEQRRANKYEADGITYKESVPAIVGNTYVLRSITFGDADALVAFKIQRKDTDGSLIIFWKMLKEFEKPMIDRSAAR